MLQHIQNSWEGYGWGYEFEKSIVNSLTARFSSYPTGRTQSISVNGTISEPMPIQFGVSRGSVLGPLLFIMYINNLPLAVRACSMELYADDTLTFLLVNLLAKFRLDFQRISID